MAFDFSFFLLASVSFQLIPLFAMVFVDFQFSFFLLVLVYLLFIFHPSFRSLRSQLSFLVLHPLQRHLLVQTFLIHVSFAVSDLRSSLTAPSLHFAHYSSY